MKLEIEPQLLVDRQLDGPARKLFETRALDLRDLVSGRKIRHGVVAFRIGPGSPLKPRIGVSNDDRRTPGTENPLGSTTRPRMPPVVAWLQTFIEKPRNMPAPIAGEPSFEIRRTKDEYIEASTVSASRPPLRETMHDRVFFIKL